MKATKDKDFLDYENDIAPLARVKYTVPVSYIGDITPLNAFKNMSTLGDSSQLFKDADRRGEGEGAAVEESQADSTNQGPGLSHVTLDSSNQGPALSHVTQENSNQGPALIHVKQESINQGPALSHVKASVFDLAWAWLREEERTAVHQLAEGTVEMGKFHPPFV